MQLKVFFVGFAIGLGGCALPQRVPGDGLYNGELCVAMGTQPPNCGAAALSLSHGRAKVRVSDFVYDLELHAAQLDVMLIHGSTLVDVFSADYSWENGVLRFVDNDRRVAYRVRFADLPGQ